MCPGPTERPCLLQYKSSNWRFLGKGFDGILEELLFIVFNVIGPQNQTPLLTATVVWFNREVYQVWTVKRTPLRCLHLKCGAWLSCSVWRPVNPAAWLLCEQPARVHICQEYAALCKNTEEVKNGIPSVFSTRNCCSAVTQQLRVQSVYWSEQQVDAELEFVSVLLTMREVIKTK